LDERLEIGDETAEIPDGAAHFLEHKLFENETNHIFNSFMKLGASVNAYTTFSSTAYYFNCFDGFDENLRLLLNFTSNPWITDENVEKEKGIICQEINMYRDNPFWRVYFNLLDAMYEKCPVRKNIAGSVESVMSIDKDILLKCFKGFYYPGNMALICAGDFDGESSRQSVYAAAETLRDDRAAGALKRAHGLEPETVNRVKTEERMSVSRPMFNIGFKEKVTDETNIALRIVSAKILMDVLAGESSDFFRDLYEDEKADGPFGFEYLSGEGYGASVLSNSCDNPDDAVERIINEIQNLKLNGVNEDRFELIRTKHLGRFARSFNSIDAITNGAVDLFSKSIDFFNILRAYDECSAEMINDRLRGMDNYSVSIARP
jgi:predicted Zn-dependent peptidase